MPGARVGGAVAVASAIIAGVILALLALRHLRRTPVPLIDLYPFNRRTFLAVARGGSLHRIAIGVAPFLLPVMFQIGMGLDAFTAGSLVLWLFAGNIFMKLFTSRLLRLFGFRAVMSVNGVLAAVSIALCGLIGPTITYSTTAAILFVGGLFRSMQFTGLTTLQFADIPKLNLTAANTLAAMMQQMMLAVGVAVGTGMLNASATLRHQGDDVFDLADFHNAFFGLAILTLIGTIDFVLLDRHAASQVSGHLSKRRR